MIGGQRRSEDRHRARERPRSGRRLVHRAEHQLHQVVEDEHEGEGQEELERHVGPVDAPEEEDLHHPANQRHQDRTHEQRHPEVAPEGAEDRVGQVGAEHVQRAVREVQHAQHAEDEREPGGDQPEVHRLRQADETLEEEHASHAALRCAHASTGGKGGLR